MKDYIVNKVRETRKKIENAHGKNWEQIKNYFIKAQNKHDKNLFIGHPRKLRALKAM